MPPKVVDVNILVAKRDNILSSLHELFEEFELVIAIEPELNTVKNIYAQIEPKYRLLKKQLEAVTDKAIELGLPSDNEILSKNSEVGLSAKDLFLKITKTYATYQKAHAASESKPIEGFK